MPRGRRSLLALLPVLEVDRRVVVIAEADEITVERRRIGSDVRRVVRLDRVRAVRHRRNGDVHRISGRSTVVVGDSEFKHDTDHRTHIRCRERWRRGGIVGESHRWPADISPRVGEIVAVRITGPRAVKLDRLSRIDGLIGSSVSDRRVVRRLDGDFDRVGSGSTVPVDDLDLERERRVAVDVRCAERRRRSHVVLEVDIVARRLRPRVGHGIAVGVARAGGVECHRRALVDRLVVARVGRRRHVLRGVFDRDRGRGRVRERVAARRLDPRALGRNRVVARCCVAGDLHRVRVRVGAGDAVSVGQHQPAEERTLLVVVRPVSRGRGTRDRPAVRNVGFHRR